VIPIPEHTGSASPTGQKTGTGANGEEFVYEPGDVAQADGRGAINDSWTTGISEVQKQLMTLVIYSWAGGNATKSGY